ncbi:MAG: ferritin-like fold-containing protein, partial [Rhodococcus sp. (in: high G+C Gram-positive bacteria)]
MGAESSPSTASSSPTLVPADHPGVAELFAVIAYGEIAA